MTESPRTKDGCEPDARARNSRLSLWAGLTAVAVAATLLLTGSTDLEAWERQLRSTTALDRRIALIGLRDHVREQPARVLQTAVSELSHPVDAVNQAAEETVRRAAKRAPDAAVALLAEDQRSSADRKLLAHVLMNLDRDLLPELIAALPTQNLDRPDEDPFYRVLREHRQPAVRALGALFDDTAPERRAAAARALCVFGGAALSTQDNIARGLADLHEPVRFWSARSLEASQSLQPGVSAALRAARNDRSDRVRASATHTWVRLQVSQLAKAIAAEDSAHADAIREEIVAIGRPSLPALTEALRNATVSTADPICSILFAIDGDAALDAVVFAVRFAKGDLRQRLEALVTTAGEQGLTALLDAIHEPLATSRGRLITMLVPYGDAAASAVPELVRTLHHKVAAQRLAAIVALSAIGKPAAHAVPRIEATLDSFQPEQRAHAERALQQLRKAIPDKP